MSRERTIWVEQRRIERHLERVERIVLWLENGLQRLCQSQLSM